MNDEIKLTVEESAFLLFQAKNSLKYQTTLTEIIEAKIAAQIEEQKKKANETKEPKQ